jgi:hypothetical protein
MAGANPMALNSSLEQRVLNAIDRIAGMGSHTVGVDRTLLVSVVGGGAEDPYMIHGAIDSFICKGNIGLSADKKRLSVSCDTTVENDHPLRVSDRHPFRAARRAPARQGAVNRLTLPGGRVGCERLTP